MEQNEGRALTSPAAVHGITESKESRLWSNLLVFFVSGQKQKKKTVKDQCKLLRYYSC